MKGTGILPDEDMASIGDCVLAVAASRSKSPAENGNYFSREISHAERS